MRRRDVIVFFGGIASAWPLLARAEKSEMRRIGVLMTVPAEDQNGRNRVAAFREVLQERGWIEGRNVRFDFRWTDDGELLRQRELPRQRAAELVALKVDVLVTHAEGALAAKRATTSIPIVMAFSADAVATGLAASLARPGGNVTGSTVLIPEISAKRLELLKAAAPRINRVAVLVRKGGTWKTVLQMLQSKGNAMNLEVQFFEVRDRTEFGSAFSEMAKARVDGLVVSEDPTLGGDSKAIVELAAKYRWPSIGYRDLAEAGGLVGYGVDVLKIYRHAAVFVDKILKGAKPADLPIEQPTQFDLVVNLKTAKALDLTIPQSMLLRADEVIQ